MILHVHVHCHKSEAGTVVESLDFRHCYNTHRRKSLSSCLSCELVPSFKENCHALCQCDAIGMLLGILCGTYERTCILGMFVCLIQGNLLYIDHSEVLF